MSTGFKTKFNQNTMSQEKFHVYAYEESHYAIFKACHAETGENLIGTRSLDKLRMVIEERGAIMELLDEHGLERYTHGIWRYSNGLGLRPLNTEERLKLKI
jgi:hypothetical protein